MQNIGNMANKSIRPVSYNIKQGQFRGYGGCNVFTNRTTIINNNYGNYNNMAMPQQQCCNNGGSNKFMNWMMGIGLGTSVLGGILSLFGGGKKEEVAETKPTTTRTANNEPDKYAQAEQNCKLFGNGMTYSVKDGVITYHVGDGSGSTPAEAIADANKKKEASATTPPATTTPAATTTPEKKVIPTYSKEKVDGADGDYKSYTVTGGDSWYYVVSEKYGLSDHSEIMAVVRELQKQAVDRGELSAVGADEFYKAGEKMTLPSTLTISVNGKTKTVNLDKDYADTAISTKVSTTGNTSSINGTVVKERNGATWDVYQTVGTTKTKIASGLTEDAADAKIKEKTAKTD